MTAALLCPADPLNPRRPDPHFAEQVATARELGAVVGLIDHEALVRGSADEAVRRVPRGLGTAYYRGWIIPSADYAALQGELAERDTVLATTPDAYLRGHELPGWYEAFKSFTPQTALLPVRPGQVPTPHQLAALVSLLPPGAGIVKDWVKSRKHEWDTACFIPDLNDAPQVAKVVGRFLEGQGEDLTGGVVLRAFEQFSELQARVWWVDGEPVLTTPHPDTPGQLPEGADPAPFASAVRSLNAPFVTTDLVLRSDGVWRVIEVGDGQVSDLPAGVDPSLLLSPLLHRAAA